MAHDPVRRPNKVAVKPTVNVWRLNGIKPNGMTIWALTAITPANIAANNCSRNAKRIKKTPL